MKKVDHQYKSVPRNYSLLKEIRSDKLYKSSVESRDRSARKILEQYAGDVNTDDIVPGNLYVFKYFTPKTKEDLEYYDAMPCSIVFGTFKTKAGERRLLCFNIHYYPPRIRYQVLSKVFDIYKQVYKQNWKTGLERELDNMDYAVLLTLLAKAKLDFGVRAYIPNLIAAPSLVPPSLWHVAVFTEGHFKKRTRNMIMNYWKNWKG